MLPLPPRTDFVFMGNVNPVLFGKKLVDAMRPTGSSNFLHSRLCQFSVYLFLALGLPFFVNHVLRVFGICSKPKMIGANAKPNIAMVQDTQRIRNGAEMKHPTGAVRTYSWTIPAVANPPVTVAPLRPFPKPAAISFLDLLPKAVGEVGGKPLLNHPVGGSEKLRHVAFPIQRLTCCRRTRHQRAVGVSFCS